LPVGLTDYIAMDKDTIAYRCLHLPSPLQATQSQSLLRNYH
jgi:hypothetical protein